jgi:diadenosine tetraphosphate (Ap4A) HIT family hydrolase
VNSAGTAAVIGPGECYSCDQERGFATLPPRERIAADRHWRVAHAIGTALPGWLVLLPRRHVTAVAGLTDAEAAGLGLWQVRLSRALHAVIGCTKTYVIQLAEAEGFSHVHFHLIPRMPDWPPELVGPQVFALLRRPVEEQVTAARMDRSALDLRARLDDDGPGHGNDEQTVTGV